MQDKAVAMVLSSFAADALALGAHWIYDVSEIDARFGRIEGLMKPLENSYHATKDLGDFTHYGDQTLVLLESVAESSGFDINDFALRWRRLFDEYDGYIDKATRSTLANFVSGKGPKEAGSLSSDMAGAARVAPLVYHYQDDLPQLMVTARDQTAMTHNNPEVIDASRFFARVAWKVLKGETPIAAINEGRESVLRDSILGKWAEEGIESARTETRTAILKFGQSCHIDAAFPSVLHLVCKYEQNPKEALIENAMAGGDSAARGLVAGMILGAHTGFEAVSGDWVSRLKHHKNIIDLLKKAGGPGMA